MRRTLTHIAVLSIALMAPVRAATETFLGDSSGASGTSISVPLQFVSDEEIVGVQFDISSEDDVGTVSGVTPGLDFSFTDHSIETEPLSNGAFRVLVSSRNSSPLYSGNLARIAVDLSANIPANSRSVALANVVFATRSGTRATLEVVPHLSLTNPAQGALSPVGTEIHIGVVSADTIESGSVVQVEFFANGASVGIDTSAPYATPWTPSAPGNYAITAIATSSSGTARTSIALPVHIGVASGFEGWQLANFDTAQLADPNISGTGADPDSDRLPNAGEFAFGGSPLHPDPSLLWTNVLTDPASGDRYLSVSYWRSIFATDATISIEESESLSNWQPASASIVELLVVPDGDFEQVTILDTVPIGAGEPRKMLRAKIDLP